MDNPTTYEFDKVIPSFLTTNNIILLGRGNDPVKRYELPIKAMEFISKEIPDCQMNIVSSININLQNFILKLKLENNVRFTGFSENIEIYLSNASLHILSSLSESYPMALGEVKIFGIPSILCGLDHLALAKGGTIIIYDDNPSTIAYWAIKILKNKDLRKKLGYDARVSMKQRNNEIIAKKWTKLLLSVYYRDEKTYQELLNESNNKITIEQANNILKNQLNLLKKRMPIFKNISFEKFISYSLI
jgi:glycosyltransferase involved in cell wall biosynthesis